MSVSSLFEISQRSFRALNAKMDATGQNIANSNTEGYSRRRATLEASNTVSPGLYTSSPGPATGDGTTVSSYERMRSRMLDTAAAEAKTGESGAREEGRILSVLEGSLATDTEGSLTSSLESFFGGLNDLAKNPTDQGVRETVLAKADALTAEFGRVDQKIGALANDTRSALSDSVDEANSLIKEVASLNEKINEARASGTPDLAAKDRRDAAVKELSGFIPVDVQEDAETGYTLSVNGMNVVQGSETTLLRARSSQSQASKQFSVTATDSSVDLTTAAGKEDAVSIDQGDFSEGEGPTNLDSFLAEGDPSPHAGVEAPIGSDGNFEGSLEGGKFNITVEDGAGSQELDFIVENEDGDIVTGGAQTLDLSSGDNDIILEEGSGGTDNIELDVLDNEGFAPDDVTSGKIEETTVEFGSTGVAFEPGDENAGELGAQVRALNQTLPEVQNELDTLAKDVATEVNTIHETGYDQNGDTGNAFFDPAGTTASSIQRAVSAPEGIAAYGAADEPGDTTPAQDMAALSDSLTPQSIELAANVGTKVQQAASREEAKAATADHLQSLAEGVSGVSLDEEMSSLIEQQQQFAASARVLRTAQEVTSTLLSM